MSKLLRIASLLTCLLLVFTIVGCSNAQNDEANTTTAPESTPEAATAEPEQSGEVAGQPLHKLTEEPSTLSIWFRGTPALGKIFNSFEETVLFQTMAEKTNVTLDFDVPVFGQENEAFQLMIASNDYPDLICGVSAYYSGGGDKAINDGVIIKLNDYIDTLAPDYAALRTSRADIEKATLTDSGNIFQFAVVVQGDVEPPYTGLSIRQDWLDDLGLAAPVTYDEFHDVLVAFKDQKGATKPFAIDASGIPGRSAFTGGLGFYAAFPGGAYATNEFFYQVDGTVKYGPLEPGFKEYVTMMAQWYSEGLVDPDFLSVKTNNDITPIIANGEAGIATLSHAQWPIYKASSDDPDFRLVALANPVKTAGDQMHVAMRNNCTFDDWGVAVSTNCENPELAVRYLNSWFTPEGTMLANWGIEGQSYSMVDGKPQLTDLLVKNPDGLILVDAISKYIVYMFPSHRDYTRFYQGNNDDQLSASSVWLSNADTAYMMPVTTMTVDESSTYASVMNDINTYAQEATIKMIMGLTPISEFDTMVQTIQGMGIDDAIAAKQAALDRYNAR